MTLRQYLTIMALATGICWIAWVLVIVQIDPYQAGNVGFLLFYVTTFFALIGSISLLAFTIYRFVVRNELPLYRYVKQSFRDGLVGAGILTGLLYLQASRLLTFWNVTFFILLLIVILAFSVTTKHEQRITDHSDI